jgi:hypothetical protein
MLVRRHSLAGRTAMRISVSNWSTTDDDVECSIDPIIRCPRSVAS